MLGHLAIAAQDKNGLATGSSVPGLTQDDALAIWEYLRAESLRAGIDWRDWYEAGLCALGYEKRGDKFEDQPNQAVKAGCCILLWNEYFAEGFGQLEAYAARRQAGGLSPFAPREFRPSGSTLARFRRVSLILWEKLKRDRGGVDPIDIMPIPSPWTGTDIAIAIAIGYLVFVAGKGN